MEHGIFASWDMGGSWEKINVDLPNVSVRDLRIQARDRDLIVGTHGRGVYILDDIRPIEELEYAEGKEIHLFPIRDGIIWNMYWRIENLGDRHYVAKNPDYGTNINFSLSQDATESIEVEIKDERGQHITPGTYNANLKYKGQTISSKIKVRGDLRINLPIEDYQEKLTALLALRDLLSETHELIDYVDTVIEQLDDLKMKLNSNSSSDNADLISLSKKIADFKDEELMRPPPSMSYRQRPRLRGEIRSLMRAIDNTTNSPTVPQLERIESLAEELNQHKTMMNDMESRINEINESNASLPQIILKGN